MRRGGPAIDQPVTASLNFFPAVNFGAIAQDGFQALSFKPGLFLT